MGRENANKRREKREVRKEKKEHKVAKEEVKRMTAEERAKLAAQEEDLDALLAEFEKVSASREKVEITACPPPSPRVNFTFFAHPAKDEVLLFGGEFFNGASQYVYGDFFSYSPKKNEWKQVVSPNSPPPRCGHAAAVRARGGGELYIFGGEFMGKSQEKFKHYNDLWVFYFAENRWEKVDAKDAPTPRSGHRMVIAGSFLYIFGGYFDNGKAAPKFFADVHVFDLDQRQWLKVVIQKSVITPTPRSACQMAAPTDDRVLVIGGYSRARKGQVDKGEHLTDAWALEREDPAAPAGDGAESAASEIKLKWTKLRPSGAVPSTRTGAVMVARPQTTMAYSFGGVTDIETEWAVSGSFLNDLFVYTGDQDKWSAVQLRQGMEVKEVQERREQMHRERIRQRIAEQKARKLAAKRGSGAAGNPAPAPKNKDSRDEAEAPAVVFDPQAQAVGAVQQEEKDKDAEGRSASGVWPRPRSSVGLAIKGKTLYLYGGYYEIGDRQVTLSDLYELDLGKLDQWKLVQETDEASQKWLDEDDGDGFSTDSDSDEGSDEDSD